MSAAQSGLARLPALLPGAAARRRIDARLALVRPASGGAAPARSAVRAAVPARGVPGGAAVDWVLGIDRKVASDEPMKRLPAVAAAAAAGAAGYACLSFLLGLSGVLPVLVGAGAAMFAARATIGAKRDAARGIMEEQFEQALGVIIRCVRAGLPVNEGMRAVGSETAAPTGPEFRAAVDQMQLGTGFEAALKGLADRCNIADYRFFATAVSLQRQTGGNLAETLDNLADTMRKRRTVRLKARALTSETRATVLVLALLPALVAAVMMVINPDYIMQLVDNPDGRRLLGAAVVIQALGLAIIRTITRRTLQ